MTTGLVGEVLRVVLGDREEPHATKPDVATTVLAGGFADGSLDGPFDVRDAEVQDCPEDERTHEAEA